MADHRWTISEIPRSERLFNLLCTRPLWSRRWMLIQPFRWLLFRKVTMREELPLAETGATLRERLKAIAAKHDAHDNWHRDPYVLNALEEAYRLGLSAERGTPQEPLDTIPCTCPEPEYAHQEHEENCPRLLEERRRRGARAAGANE